MFLCWWGQGMSFLIIILAMLEEVIKRTWLPGDLRAGYGKSGMPCLYSSLECTFSSPFPQPEPFQGCSLEKVRCWWDFLDWKCDWAQWRLRCTLLRFWWANGEITRLAATQDKPHKFSCILNLPATNLECLPPSLVPICPLCPGASFRFHSENSWVCKPTTVIWSTLTLSWR